MKFLYWQNDSALVKEFTHLISNAEFQRCESFDDVLKNQNGTEALNLLVDLDLLNKTKADLKGLKKAFKKIEDLEVIYFTTTMDSKELAKHQTSGVGGTAYFKGPLHYDEIAPVLEQIFNLPMMVQDQATRTENGMDQMMGLLEKERSGQEINPQEVENLTSSINLKFEEAFGSNFDYDTFDKFEGESPGTETNNLGQESSSGQHEITELDVLDLGEEEASEQTGVGLSEIEDGLDIGILAENEAENSEGILDFSDEQDSEIDGGGNLSDSSDDDPFTDGTDMGTQTRIDPVAIDELADLASEEDDAATRVDNDILDEELVLGDEDSDANDESSQIFEALTEDISGVHVGMLNDEEAVDTELVDEYDESKTSEVEEELNLEQDFALSLEEDDGGSNDNDLVNEVPEGELIEDDSSELGESEESSEELELGDEEIPYDVPEEEMIDVGNPGTDAGIDFEGVRDHDDEAFEQQSNEDFDEISINFGVDAAGLNDDQDNDIDVLDVNGASVDTSMEAGLNLEDELLDEPEEEGSGEFLQEDIGDEDSTRVYQAGENTSDSLITQFDDFSDVKEPDLTEDEVEDLSEPPVEEDISPDESLKFSLDGLELKDDVDLESELDEPVEAVEAVEDLSEEDVLGEEVLEQEEPAYDFTDPKLSMDVLTPEPGLIDEELAAGETPDGNLLAEIEDKTSFIQKAEEIDAENELVENSQTYEYSDDVKQKLAEIDDMLANENFESSSDSSISNHPLSNLKKVKQPVQVPTATSHDVSTADHGLLSQIRQDHLGIMEELKQERRAKKDLERDCLQLKSEVEEKNIELNLFRNKNNQKLVSLQNNVDLLHDQNKRLVEKNYELMEQLKQLKKKFQINMENPQTNRSDLEQKLELVKVDSESQIRNRDKKILELKRKIDMLEFDMENLIIKEKQMNQSKVSQEDRHQKILQALEIAFKLLQEEQLNGNLEPMLPSKKNMNA